MASSVKDMLAAANSAVPRIQPADLRDRMSKGDVVVVDVRDAPELATGGKIKGAVHVPRGMASDVILAWIVTLPATALFGAAFYELYKLLS